MKKSQLFLTVIAGAAWLAATPVGAMPIDNRINPDGTPVLIPSVRKYEARQGVVQLPREFTVSAPDAAENEFEVLASLVKRYFPEHAVNKAGDKAFCRLELVTDGVPESPEGYTLEIGDRDPLGRGWNRRQSMIAVGSGGAFGKGFLKGDQNILGYIPQQVSANDFIFSVLAEEKGFAGSSFLLACYGILLLSVLAAGAAAPEDSGRLLCVGVATLVFCHAFVNVGMSVGMLPITGMPLPFVSYGRTFLAALGLAFGLVQGVAVRSGVQKSKGETNGNEH